MHLFILFGFLVVAVIVAVIGFQLLGAPISAYLLLSSIVAVIGFHLLVRD